MKHFYLKNCLYLLLFTFSITSVYAQNTSDVWSKISKKEALSGKKLIRKTEPKKSVFYTLDVEQLKNSLNIASKNASGKTAENQIIEFPNSEGGFDAYNVKESPILEPAFQEKHPEIRTYVGKNIKNPASNISFSITPQGLHAMISTTKGTQFLDPYTKNNTYIAYNKGDLPVMKEAFQCYVPENLILEKETNSAKLQNVNDSKLRTFRLALASTIEYSEFHWLAAGLTASDTEANKKAAVLAAMVVTMNRVNTIFQRDLAIKMTLVDNTNIIFIDSDNFTNDDADLLIDESQVEIDNGILTANYDIGHTFSTGGGGLASLNSPCVTSSKAMGITGSTNPVGDAYDIDYVAHEMGHQFGAPHTFNGNTNNCAGGNRTASNAYEPGSGSTIMAYAGICSPQNVQSQSDVYFHQKSIQMIWDNITTGFSTCGSETTLSNSAPTANAGGNYTIPISTPYKLTGSSTDADGIASHTYTWEQYDLGTAGLPNETNTTGPLVRSFEGTTNVTRYIPNLKDLKTSNGSTTWEKLTAVDRAINFQLTVRDNNANGGQTATDGMTITTTSAAGPFLVTSQNTSGLSWSQGATETIIWDVAGTTANGVNTSNVNILLSTDGGLNYDTVLASNVANDGSHDIVVPNTLSAFCRIMVEAVGNIFFAINTEDFSIGYSMVETCVVYNSTDSNLPLTITDNGSDFTEISSVNVSATGTVSNVKLTVNISHDYPGDILLGLQSPENNLITVLESFTPCQNEDTNLIVTFDDDGSVFDCNSTGDGLNMKSPSASLSGWNGEVSNGNWLLGVGDSGATDIGTLNSWSIEVCTLELIPLKTETIYSFDNILVYPNPNKGEFTIKLNSDISNNITVKIADIRGRMVFNKAYTIDGNFDETLKLQNVQSGMYILNVSDGKQQTSKKIIIE